MSVINFPNSPTLYQTFTVGSKTWIWNGYAWDLQLANTAPILSLAQSAYNQANSASSNTVYLQSALNQTNTNIVSANTQMQSYVNGQVSGVYTYYNGVTASQNTNITTATNLAQGAYNKANTPQSILANGSYTLLLRSDGNLILPTVSVMSTTGGAIDASGVVVINANGNQWQFDTLGNLNSPYNVSITTHGIQFSDGSLQNTAAFPIAYSQGVSNSQNTAISTASSNTIYLFGALNQTNTNIVSANTQLKSYVDGQISIQQNINNTQNTTIQTVWNTANVGYNFVGAGGSVAGSVNINGNLQVTGNISYTGNVISQTITGNSAQFFGNNTTGFNALYAGVGTGFSVEPQTVFQLSANYNGYAQLNFENENSGIASSTDLVCTADNGNANNTYIDMGINSSLYNQPGFGLTGPNDGYLYVYGNTATGGGNLVLSTFTAKDIIFSTNGGDTPNEVFRVSGTSNNVIIKSGGQSTSNTTGSLVVNGGIGVTGNVNATGSLSVFNGMYSTGSFVGPYTDGVIVDYVTGNGRVSVGSGDGITFYNNTDTSRNSLLYLAANGSIYGSTFNGSHIGSGAGLTSLNASNLTTGTVSLSLLGSGTANSSTYLRGDGTWQTITSTGGTTISTSRSTVTATSGQTVFTTPTYIIGQNQISVFINGVKQIITTDYTETSTTSITLTSGATLNDVLQFEVNGYTLNPYGQSAIISNDNSSNTPRYLLLSQSNSGGLVIANTSSANLSFIPSTGALTATSFSGSGANLTALTAGNLLGTIPSGVLGNSSLYVGTTAITLNAANNSITNLNGVTINSTTIPSSATLLTSSNYNSYAPTLTGTGASGTWSISVTGTAGGIATSANLQVNSIGVNTTADSANTGSIRATGQITAYYSDERLKDILGNIPNAVDKVKSLDGFYYKPNALAQSLGYKEKLEVGVSAQQVQKILPEIIAAAPIDDKYLTINYERLVPLLIEAIKEQQDQIDELKSIIKEINRG